MSVEIKISPKKYEFCIVIDKLISKAPGGCKKAFLAPRRRIQLYRSTGALAEECHFGTLKY